MSAKELVKRVAGAMVRRLEQITRGRALVASEVREVLVLEYMLPLGCCVHLTPVYEAMKRQRPEIRLTVATSGLGAELLRHHAYVDRVLVTPNPLTDLAGAARSLRAQMRAAGVRPDWVLTGASDQRTRIALLAVATGGLRAGFTLAPELYQKPLAYDSGRSLIDNNLRLLELLDRGAEHVEPRLFFSRREAERASQLLGEANPDGRPVLVLVTQTSGGQRTGWLRERFVEVIRFAATELAMQVVYVGTAGDAAAIEEIRSGRWRVGDFGGGQDVCYGACGADRRKRHDDYAGYRDDARGAGRRDPDDCDWAVVAEAARVDAAWD